MSPRGGAAHSPQKGDRPFGATGGIGAKNSLKIEN